MTTGATWDVELADEPPGSPRPAPGESPPRRVPHLRRPWWQWLAGVTVAVAVAARFVAGSNLWLDEALTVNIARLPLSEIPEALRHDGSPPLYYVLLHWWMQIFGDGTLAVRALSGVFSVAALPLMWQAGIRLGGRRVAAAGVVLLATSPFAVQYATEARMYSLVTLLTLAGGLALSQLMDRPSRRSSVALAAVTGALLLTHYWAIWLLGSVGILLVVLAVTGTNRSGALRALVALGAGAVLFLPWVPIVLYQAQHTGAPWGRPPLIFRAVHDTMAIFARGYKDSGPVPVLLLEALVVLGLLGRGLDRGRIELSLRGRERARALGFVTFGALVLGLGVGKVTGEAYAHRYAAVVLAGVVLLAALGTVVFLDGRVRRGVIALVAGLGLVGMVPIARHERTQAPVVAASLRAAAGPGDVVAYCPDQLGPSLSRLLPSELDQVTFPRGDRPEFVDWVDYGENNRAASPASFALELAARAGGGDIWLVWAPGYATFGTKCERLAQALTTARPGRQVVKRPSRYPERMGLIRYPA